MAVQNPKWFGAGLLAITNQSINLGSDTIKWALTTTTYTPNQDTHDFFDDVTNELSTANGYTAGGVTLGSKALSYDATSDQVRWDFADPSWTLTGSISYRWGIIYKSTGTSSTSPLIAYIDLDGSGNRTDSAGVLTFTIDSTGFLYLDAT